MYIHKTLIEKEIAVSLINSKSSQIMIVVMAMTKMAFIKRLRA